MPFFFGRFHKEKLWYVSFLAPFLQANYDSKRFRLQPLTPPDFWSPPFLHLTLGFINEPAQESSVSLLFLCPAVLHGWEKQAWLIKDCLLYLLVISLIKKVLLLDGCCISLEKKKILCPCLSVWWICLWCTSMDSKIDLLVFVVLAPKAQIPSDMATLKIGFGTEFQCWVQGFKQMNTHASLTEQTCPFCSLPD